MKHLTAVPPVEKAFSLTLLRIVLGSILFVEGAGKLWGWFDGAGLQMTRVFYDHMHVPLSPYHAVIVGSVEFFGGILLALGLLTRLAIAIISVTMIAAIWIIAADSGAVHNSHLILFTISLVLLQFGGGPWSLDSRIFTSKKG